MRSTALTPSTPLLGFNGTLDRLPCRCILLGNQQDACMKPTKKRGVSAKEFEPNGAGSLPARHVHHRNVVGKLINFRGLVYAPVNENGVIFLFGKVAADLN